MSEDFKTKLNSLLSAHQAAKRKGQESLRKLDEPVPRTCGWTGQSLRLRRGTAAGRWDT
jgi:hypothetical protein